MNFNNFANKLSNALSKDLPGFETQKQMAPKGRQHKVSTMPEGVKKSAVLLLIYLSDNEYKLVFIKRANDGGRHSGQIAFPGGKFEEEDENLKATALRETEEEIGVSKVKIVGTLSSIYIPVSNYFVQPVVGILNKKPRFTKSDDEVETIYSVNINELVRTNIITKTFEINGQTITAPFYIFNNFELWGATAMILSEFIEVLNTSLNIRN